MVSLTLNGILVADIWLRVQVLGNTRYSLSAEPRHALIRSKLENGYAIWDFKGQELTKLIQDRFKQFIWRPRPRTLLSKEQQQQIRKNLRKYSQKFDEEDAAYDAADSLEQIAHRRRLVDEWNAWRVRCKKDLADKPSDGEQPTEDKEEIEIWVDEVIEQKEEVVTEE